MVVFISHYFNYTHINLHSINGFNFEAVHQRNEILKYKLMFFSCLIPSNHIPGCLELIASVQKSLNDSQL